MRKKSACVPLLGGALPVPLPAMYCLLGSILQDVADLVLVSCVFAIALCSSLGSVLARYASAALTRGTGCPSSSSLSCSEGLAHSDANMFNLAAWDALNTTGKVPLVERRYWTIRKVDAERLTLIGMRAPGQLFVHVFLLRACANAVHANWSGEPW